MRTQIHFSSILTSVITLIIISLLIIQTSTQSAAADNGRMQWWRDARFGMFIHWGLYSIPAGEWKGQEYPFIGEWIMRWAEIPAERYRQLARGFYPIHYDAEFIAQLAADAGMRYLVITAKHHDGFSMFRSAVTDYDIIDATPFDRDPLKELEMACRRRNIKYGFYYSHAQDWNEPNAAGNTWDFPTPTEQRDYAQYLQDKAIPQVRELLRNYGSLGTIWFDTPQLLTRAQALELQNLVAAEQPECLVNSRIGYGGGDYRQMGDNQVPSNIYPVDWEIPGTLNDTWGFKKDDRHWKSTGYLLYRLVDVVSKGGNYLLNIGPRADGSIPEASVRRLKELGRWMDINGEAIYGTDPSPFTHDASHRWRCTVKPGKLYIHLLRWPGRTFSLRGLNNSVSRAYLLADPDQDSLLVRQKGGRTSIELPGDIPDPYISVLVLEIENPLDIDAAYSRDIARDYITLSARDASPHGPWLRYSEYDASITGFRESRDRIRWSVLVKQPGRFDVSINYSCRENDTGDTYQINTNQQELEAKVQVTGGFAEEHHVGSIEFRSGGLFPLYFSLDEPRHSSDMRVESIALKRTKN